PPVKIHCSVLAEDAIRAAIADYRTKNGLAVVPVTAGKCTGCHMKLVASTLVKVHSQVEGTQCESCGRLVYDGDAS
ncbi:MAG: hypothetical protein EAZ84_11625, partial [Verrucomicrobia bacterium]